MEYKSELSAADIRANEAKGDWVKMVNSETPLTPDEAEAVAEYKRRVPGERRTLRAFYHNNYGQFWIYERGWPERQIGCVLRG